MAALASFTRNNRTYGQQPIDSVVNPQRERNGLDAKASQLVVSSFDFDRFYRPSYRYISADYKRFMAINDVSVSEKYRPVVVGRPPVDYGTAS
ncbi:hypothetical protein COOONC_12890 [Cooperia oncophora]